MPREIRVESDLPTEIQARRQRERQRRAALARLHDAQMLTLPEMRELLKTLFPM